MTLAELMPVVIMSGVLFGLGAWILHHDAKIEPPPEPPKPPERDPLDTPIIKHVVRKPPPGPVMVKVPPLKKRKRK